MTIPDTLKMLGINVFLDCFKLVPTTIDVGEEGTPHNPDVDATPQVFDYLRSQSKFAALEMQLSEQSAKISSVVTQNQSLNADVSSLNANVSSLHTMIGHQSSEMTALKQILTHQSSEITSLKQTLQTIIASFPLPSQQTPNP